LKQIALKQFLPIAVGTVVAWFAPKMSQRFQPTLNVLGKVLLSRMIAVVLFKMGLPLKAITFLVPVAASLLAPRSIAVNLLLRFGDSLVKEPSPSAMRTGT
jgi:hypothetical protein